MEYKKYRYGNDNFNDIGFGCSYRNIQTILSCYKIYYDDNIYIPNIRQLLNYFYPDYKKIITSGITSKLWIEPVSVSKYIHKEFNIKPLNMIYLIDDNDVEKMLSTKVNEYNYINILKKDKFYILINNIQEHFQKSKLPIIIDNSVYSYCIISLENDIVKMADPHTLDDNKIIRQEPLKFLQNNFWMIYIPQNY